MNVEKTRFSRDDMEMQYNLRLLRPDYMTAVVPEWERRSERTRATRNCTLDVRYGDGPDERMDIFPASDPDAPVLVYFHGGYWQRGNRSIYSFLSEAFVDSGITVVLPGYTLCPDTNISGIVGQARQAMRNIVAVLAEADAGPEHLVRLNWYVVDKAEYLAGVRELGAAYREVLGDHYPAMTLVRVVALLEDRARVEIEATAVVS